MVDGQFDHHPFRKTDDPSRAGGRTGVGCLRLRACTGRLPDFRSQVRPSTANRTPGLAQQASKGTLTKGDAKMLVRADEMSYDNANASVAAIGNVQIYYAGPRSRPTRLSTTRKTKRLHAEGNVRLTEADGKITYGEIIDMTDDFRDGFVDSLRVDTPDQTRMAATAPTAVPATSRCWRTASIRPAKPAAKTRASRRCGRSRPSASSITRPKR